jgi:hypothetical protein
MVSIAGLTSGAVAPVSDLTLVDHPVFSTFRTPYDSVATHTVCTPAVVAVVLHSALAGHAVGTAADIRLSTVSQAAGVDR